MSQMSREEIVETMAKYIEIAVGTCMYRTDGFCNLLFRDCNGVIYDAACPVIRNMVKSDWTMEVD